MAADIWKGVGKRVISAPARSAFAITPHAVNEVGPTVPRWIICGGGGTIACRLVDDSSDVTVTLVAGYLYPLQVTHIRVSGTSATGIVGLI